MSRSPDFRFYPAENFSLSLSEHSLRLLFGLDGDGSDGGHMDGGLYMTHKTAKFLAAYLTRLVEEIELASGRTIPINEEAVNLMGNEVRTKLQGATF